ncbi:retron St85 family RNA-directed DNA polymerase [Aliarcobacter cryaerophilus]|uniref:retron St85 family RNA-directed DNA polymerase n=1 Tax=Aliarcobacter TaxID=2321111 RepID=UPI00100A3D1C|nr:retron St85 family RNA-directed DNA polymerase [Aliarcobacter trophiarum]RXI27840.1 hypothetical protein CRU89_03340 [Aliarcobacter trophiarum]
MIFLESICKRFDKDLNQIVDFSTTANKRYKTYKIKKRTSGTRTIEQPSKELKLYQKFISENIFLNLPVHEAVFSYKKNISIKNLADKHKNNRYLLRIDFKDFFPSIKGENIRLFLKNSNLKLSDLEITLINLFVCKNNKLTIGASSSPSITNVILFNFDNDVYKFCLEKNIIYSRYADDLYFSTNEKCILSSILDYIKNYIFPYNINLYINYDKNIFTSKKHRRIITGLTITTDGNISVGRKQKQYIKSLINLYRYKCLEVEQIDYLKGYLNFLVHIEPIYIDNLKNKYGEDIINELFINKFNNKEN